MLSGTFNQTLSAQAALGEAPGVLQNCRFGFSAKEEIPVLNLCWIVDEGRNRHFLGRTRMGQQPQSSLMRQTIAVPQTSALSGCYTEVSC